jgi:hypothetical protein
MKTALTTRVDANGMLTLAVPLGKASADQVVRVVVETVEGATAQTTPMVSRDDWLRFLGRTAGTINDPTFHRASQGEYEERDSLS